ncbi:aldo/keto reductase (plasmid) [Paracoccus versutus]|uniref:D-threo-aldose 1-dehydrogenase n=1 Tax=Paracoccus versutus TaxID=34007 RepID=A0AAQ0KLM0_PARVE|nr:aldo/keto reductase [Paracoccus versutus]KGJ12151.1 pyridoxal 4-dehydrogenase [Paracoccus versutus]REG44615.1 D-threo-aldose 1-dehydrogenase [Paracoccus versutus]WEJ80568.1 aldo/keto reductase [Paracoccus versutus]
MKPSDMRQFGRTDLEVTGFAFGTAPVGNIFREIDDQTSRAMFDHAWDAGVRYFDTAPMYGHGLSELRTSEALRWRNRDDFVLSSKVGRLLRPARRDSIDFAPWVNAAPFTMEFDYSYDGTMRAFGDSLQRLALERIDILFIHDIDVYTRGSEQPEVFRQAMDGCYKALARLRDEKMVKAIGVGVNEWQVCHEALKQRDFDCFLLAGRYTLLEQDALDEFLPLCEERGAAVVVGGGFNSGILATGAKPGAKYNYAPAPAEIMDRVAKIEAVCAEYDVPLPAAALQFVVAHPAVPSFCAGTRTVRQLEQNLAWMDHPIPAEFWQALKDKGLLRGDAPVPA